MTQKITPCLWFDNNIEEALDFYTSVFKDSEVLSVSRYGGEGTAQEGSVLVATFRLNGQEFTALNGGPTFTRLPLSSNAAINAIPTAQCAFSTDQRGFARPGEPGTNCDVGAVEIGLQKVYMPVTLNN